jgi:hypothetical protein
MEWGELIALRDPERPDGLPRPSVWPAAGAALEAAIAAERGG